LIQVKLAHMPANATVLFHVPSFFPGGKVFPGIKALMQFLKKTRLLPRFGWQNQNKGEVP
jgi:hypothetical protein